MATNFFTRWSQRKLEPKSHLELEDSQQEIIEESDHQFDEHAVEKTTDTSTSVATLLASQVETSVKRAALRKLFLSGQFSEVDGLNDYDHDYKAVRSLSSEVAGKLRDWVNQQDTDPSLEESIDTSSVDETDHETGIPPHKNDREQAHSTSQEVGQNRPHKD
ncbi:DUF3306 domain-containing protein [Vibrio sp. JPW-9-11-11]|uniref:DUF3306 domain-containing protein n=1 Tax=Vibrio sp. JPW-9-11-11 TaxID=1416532 RepID=UPI001594B333|nr:DUF3306 domain-containing protein [Vibrio sp. JPW-9-11-11]